MRLPHFFIDRPIFAAVLSIIILIIGAIAQRTLPIAEYPEIAPPTVNIAATYPGASAQIISETVATPIEQEVNGVDDMLYIVSQSTGDGRLSINVVFKPGTNIDQAQVLVQNRVSVAEPRLPEDVRRLGIAVRKASPDLMMVVHMTSPDGSRDQQYISNYATLYVSDVLLRLDGVGNINIFGARDYSMRVWLDPAKVANVGLTAGEVVAALRAANLQVAAGSINQPPATSPGAFKLSVQTLGRLTSPDQFEDIVVKAGEDGSVVRVRDIARVELGSQDYTVNAYLNNKIATALVIFQRPGSNALATARAIRGEMDRLARTFPPGVAYSVVYNPTDFIQSSVDAVVQTLFEAVLLVVVVVILFLQTWRAAIIPIVAIPVSLIGTFAVMAAVGISFNTLSLFGLVLAIGIVVDDAIVVVENVERYLRQGMTPREAAHKTMDDVGSALVAISLVLIAVFLPTAFIAGLQGSFYRQFAITIAASTAISAIVSLDAFTSTCGAAAEAARRARWGKEGCPVDAHGARALVLCRLQLGVRAPVERLRRDDRAFRPPRCNLPDHLWRPARPHLLSPRHHADGAHPSARPHLFHCRLSVAARLDTNPHRRGRAQGWRHHAHAPGRRGGGSLRRVRRRNLHQRPQHGRHLRSLEVLRGARAPGPYQGRHPGRPAPTDG